MWQVIFLPEFMSLLNLRDAPFSSSGLVSLLMCLNWEKKGNPSSTQVRGITKSTVHKLCFIFSGSPLYNENGSRSIQKAEGRIRMIILHFLFS